MSILASKSHTEGNEILWTVSYDDWLDNTAEIETIDVTSSSATLVVGDTQVLGREAAFYISGGARGETATISLVMVDSLANTKNDTIHFTVVAP
jgi:hypothetical protein